jgi:hypothetical protein
VLLAIGIAAAILLVFGSRRVEHGLRLRAAGLLLWLLVPMLLTIRHSIPLYNYYFLFVLPTGALLIGLGLQQLAALRLSRRASRMLVGTALGAGIGLASIQSVMVLRQLDYLTQAYVPDYGPPLDEAEQTTRELVDRVDQSGGRQLSVEIDDVNDVAIGYLARPYVPDVQVVRRRRGPWNTDFDLPGQSGAPPAVPGPAPQLTTPARLDVSYTDGVRALSESTTRVVSPGESVGLAMTWTVDGPPRHPLTNRLLWEVSMYDPSAHEIGREAGIAYDWNQIDNGKVVESWFTVPTATGAEQGMYQVHVRRLDPVTRSPLPANGSVAEWSSGEVQVLKRGATSTPSAR